MKCDSRCCPVCDEIYEELEYAKVHLGAGVQINMRCANNHKWSEFYSFSYQGYWFKGQHYDSYGNAKIESKEEIKEETMENDGGN